MKTSLVNKYQPRSISEFVGLAEPKAILGALAREPYASSYLLVGPAGLGKTTIAQAFADEVRGEVIPIPSAKCDKATVDEVAEHCQSYPMFGSMFVVVCDEADRMTPSAQICWLSKLDSTAPLPHTIVVFTCNDTSKLEERFLSRCKVIEFTPPAETEVVEHLRKVWQAETRAPEPDLAAIAAKAKGNVRSALNALELKLLVAQEPAETPKRTWFDTVSAATPSAKRMKRILVKNESTGQWDRVMVEVPA